MSQLRVRQFFEGVEVGLTECLMFMFQLGTRGEATSGIESTVKPAYRSLTPMRKKSICVFCFFCKIIFVFYIFVSFGSHIQWKCMQQIQSYICILASVSVSFIKIHHNEPAKRSCNQMPRIYL
jgi:hypothetical protein